MEEVKNTDTKSNYIELSNDLPGGNIFSELSEDLWELDFWEKAGPKSIQKKDLLAIGYNISSILLTITIITGIVLGLDTYFRSDTDNSFSSNLPLCSEYLSMGITDYENEECKTPLMIADSLNADKEKLEKIILTNLIIFVPTKIQLTDIVGSSKVQFIQEHTGDARLPIASAIARFLELKNSLTTYQGEDIDCKNLVTDEKGILTLSCDVYGWALIVPAGVETKTSREKVLAFLEVLGDMKNGFQVLSYPKSLDISQYSTTDGIKSVFSTKTSIDLKLQYLPANKM